MADLPNAVVKRLLTRHSEGMRVAGGAVGLAAAAAEQYLARLTREAHAAAVADKRKTLMESDIEQARAKLGG